MMAVLGIDQNSLYLVIAVLVFLIAIVAVFKGRSLKLWFRKAGLQVGEEGGKKSGPAPGSGNVNVLNEGKVNESNVNIQVGDSVHYGSPAKEEPPTK